MKERMAKYSGVCGALWLLVVLAGGCSLDYRLQECPYNVRFTYVPGDGRGMATGDYPITGLRQFVYDADGILVGEFAGDTCTTGIGTVSLPPGDYTLVTWGNASDELCSVESVSPGLNRMEEGCLKSPVYVGGNVARAVQSEAAGEAGNAATEHCNTGKFYYGTLSFTAPAYGVAEYSVGMMHAHARLNLTLEWKDEIPANVRSAVNPVMWLHDVGTCYRFTGGEVWGDYCFPCHDAQTPTGTYRTDATKDADYKIKGSFTTLRLTDDNHPVVTVTDGTDGLMQVIDLSRYFTVMGIGLTRNIRQEFDLTIRIGRNQTLIMQTNTSGWEDGGTIGTN